MKNSNEFKSAFVALIGRPNCGKSTLLNLVCGEKLSIVTSLPQTTRRNLRGIYTNSTCQIVFVDTPGIHHGKHMLNKSMYAQSSTVLDDAGIDIICYIVDLSRRFGEEENIAAKLVAPQKKSTLIVFNKADICPSAGRLRKYFFERYPELKGCPNVTLSAVKSGSKKLFLSAISTLLKPGPRFYPEDELTDADMRFLAAEIIRKHIIEATRKEVPHAACVEIISYKELPKKQEIDAAIHVETKGQKGILIGARGALIQEIQKSAQSEIARFFGQRIKLRCHVRITPKWRDNKRFLKEMGMEKQA